MVDLRVQSIAAIAARSVKAFSLGVERRGSRPGLQPGEALGLFNQLRWVSVGLRERRLAENGGEQGDTDTPKQWAVGSPGHDTLLSISRGA